MDKAVVNTSTLTAIADAINAKSGTSGKMLPSQMAGKIADIPAGDDAWLELDQTDIETYDSFFYVEIPYDGFVFKIRGVTDSTDASKYTDIYWGDGSQSSRLPNGTGSSQPNTVHIYEKGRYKIRIKTNYVFVSKSDWGGLFFEGAPDYNMKYITESEATIRKIVVGKDYSTTYRNILPRTCNLRQLVYSKNFGRNLNSGGCAHFSNSNPSEVYLSNATITGSIRLGLDSRNISVFVCDYITYIGSNIVNSAYSLTRIALPRVVTIENNAFQYCRSLKVVDLRGVTSIPTLKGTDAFQYTYADFKVVVPDDLFDDWLVATNWSDESIVGHIVKESEYTEE